MVGHCGSAPHHPAAHFVPAPSRRAAGTLQRDFRAALEVLCPCLASNSQAVRTDLAFSSSPLGDSRSRQIQPPPPPQTAPLPTPEFRPLTVLCGRDGGDEQKR